MANEIDENEVMSDDLILDVRSLFKTFMVGGRSRGTKKTALLAVDDVSFQVRAGETYSLVGESGSGKSTVARLLMRLEKLDKGTILVRGRDWSKLGSRQLRRERSQMQMIFQDPYASLDPTKQIVQIVGEPLIVHHRTRGAELDNKVLQLLDQVGLASNALNRYPNEFSGGQRQRIAIARALAADPVLIVADEAVSALDVSTQSQVLNLMRDIQAEHGLAFLFITHDLGVVRQVADRVGVLKNGHLVESGAADEVLNNPSSEYTRALLAAVPEVSADRRAERKIQFGD